MERGEELVPPGGEVEVNDWTWREADGNEAKKAERDREKEDVGTEGSWKTHKRRRPSTAHSFEATPFANSDMSLMNECHLQTTDYCQLVCFLKKYLFLLLIM